MHFGKRLLALSLAGILSVGCLAGCGSSNSSAGSGTAADNGSATSASSAGNVMTIGSPQSSATLDPVNGYDYWYMLRYGVCETLYKFNDDMTPSPWLVEDDYELSKDQLTWTFHIKDTVTFSDGTPLTAEHVKACIERAFEESTYPAQYFTCEAIDADGQDLSITTTEPTPTMLNFLADPIFCVYDATGDLSNIASEGPMGTGPFVFSSFDDVTHDTSVVRNENYWNGDVKLDEIDFQIIPDTSTLFMSLQSGEIDAAYSIDTSSVQQLDGDSNYTLITSASSRTDFAFLNQTGVLEDETLRQAIMRACDRQSYCTNLLYDMFTPGITPLSSSLPYGYDELNDINAYDPEGAARLLDDAGYADTDGDGYRETPDGDPLSITITTYNTRAEIPLLAQAIQASCQEIGVKMEIKSLDQASCFDMLTSGEYDMLLISIAMATAGDPETNLRMYFSTYDEDDPNYNQSGYSNKKVDKLLDKLSTTFDSDERTQIIKDIEQLMMDDSVCFYLCYPVMNFATQTNVTGITSHTSDYYWVSSDTGFTE